MVCVRLKSLLIPFPSKGWGDEKRCSCLCDDHAILCASMFFEKRVVRGRFSLCMTRVRDGGTIHKNSRGA